MPSAADRLEFAPHRDPGALRAFGLALLVHLLLGLALMWGVNWKRSNPDISFEAELWSGVPQEAAPPPPPPPPPAPEPQLKAPPPTPDADIALEREKKRKLELKQKESELLKAKEEQQRLKEIQTKKEKEQKTKEELARRKAEEAQKVEEQKQEKQKQAEAAAEKQRQENIRRIAGLAGATGGADAKGTAQKSSGPSASYGGKVRARVKPNIVFIEDIPGNPTAEVEVRTALDGSIISQRLIKSSGNKAWDEAVIKAIIRTETMPRDVDGRVPTPMILEFRPKD
jgi:colicin import membrane protein